MKKSKRFFAELLMASMILNMTAPAYAEVPENRIEKNVQEDVAEAEEASKKETGKGDEEDTVAEAGKVNDAATKKDEVEASTNESKEESAKETEKLENVTEETGKAEESTEEAKETEESVENTEESESTESKSEEENASSQETKQEETIPEETAPAESEADLTDMTAEAAKPETKEGYLPEDVIMLDEDDIPDNDDLFGAYLNNLFYGDDESSVYGNYGEDTGLLKPFEAYLYQQVKRAVIDIANGDRTSSKIKIDIDGKEWKYDELVNGKPDVIANLNLSMVVQLLLVNDPYELYWFDKTTGVSYSGLSYSYDETAKTVRTYGSLTFTLSVADGYQDGDATTVDNTKVEKAKAAAQNAKDIAEKYMDYSDDEKCLAFKNEICDLVDYNYSAAEDSSTAYGDPWQLIYVFDKDDTTSVVCEGYSKAFQYLCDLTGVECYTVSGTMMTKEQSYDPEYGPHMWNIVTIEGKNYLVDVTNCDGDEDGGRVGIGYPDSLILAGTSGSIRNGYVFAIGAYLIGYSYSEKTKALYADSDILILNETNYIKKELEEKESVIADPNLEKAMLKNHPNYDKNGDGHFSASELADENVRYINGSSSNVTSLEGLQYATHLTSIDVHDNQISDLTPIADLPNIRFLTLYKNQISDIRPLTGLTKTRLEYLYLENNQIEDISALSEMTALKEVFLNNNLITELPKLDDMTSLTWLIIDHNRLKDITNVKYLTSLEMLYVYANQLSDLSAVGELTNLVSLYTGDNPDVREFPDLTRCVNLSLYYDSKPRGMFTGTGLGRDSYKGKLAPEVEKQVTEEWITSNFGAATQGPTIVEQPQNAAVSSKTDTAVFHVKADDVKSYQWQFSRNNGATWQSAGFSGSRTPEMTVELNASRMNYIFRCELTGMDDTKLYTDTVKAEEQFAILQQPSSAEVTDANETVAFEVEASGVQSYQWQFSRDHGQSWQSAGFSGSRTSKMTVEFNTSRINYVFRCKLTGADGSELYTDTVKAGERFEITTQPADVEVSDVSEPAVFKVEATGARSYQWQFSRDHGQSWQTAGFTGSRTPEMTVELNASRMNYIFRCELTGADGSRIYTDTVQAKERFMIVTQPSDVTISDVNETVVFAVAASGAKSYQWQFSRDNGKSWQSAGFTGSRTAEMHVALNASRAKYKFRCELTGSDGSKLYTDVVGAGAEFAITRQPLDAVTEDATTKVAFEVEATGVKTYQWQFSRDGGENWQVAGFPGARSSKISVELNSVRRKYVFRCELTSEDGETLYTETVKIK